MEQTKGSRLNTKQRGKSLRRLNSTKSSKSTKITKKKRKTEGPKIVVRFLSSNASLPRECAKMMGYLAKDKDHENWDVSWANTNAFLKSNKFRLDSFQKINHFPAMSDLARKDSLANNLNEMRQAVPESYDFFPRTFSLPREVRELKAHVASLRRRGLRVPPFISKPNNSCQGKGIELVMEPERLWEAAEGKGKRPYAAVVQRYLDRPLLVDGYKFDCRLYVLVTSVRPLEVLLFRDGLARLATRPYRAPTKKNARNVRMHLTNFSLNKRSRHFDDDAAEDRGSKRALLAVLAGVAAERGVPAVEKLWDRIGQLIARTLICVQPALVEAYELYFGVAKPRHLKSVSKGSACFEILGFDIFIDDNLRPWLIEVNHAPSFAPSSPLDRRLKTEALCGAFRLVLPNRAEKGRWQRHAKRELAQKLWTTKPTFVRPAAAEDEEEEEAPPGGGGGGGTQRALPAGYVSPYSQQQLQQPPPAAPTPTPGGRPAPYGYYVPATAAAAALPRNLFFAAAPAAAAASPPRGGGGEDAHHARPETVPSRPASLTPHSPAASAARWQGAAAPGGLRESRSAGNTHSAFAAGTLCPTKLSLPLVSRSGRRGSADAVLSPPLSPASVQPPPSTERRKDARRPTSLSPSAAQRRARTLRELRRQEMARYQLDPSVMLDHGDGGGWDEEEEDDEDMVTLMIGEQKVQLVSEESMRRRTEALRAGWPPPGRGGGGGGGGRRTPPPPLAVGRAALAHPHSRRPRPSGHPGGPHHRRSAAAAVAAAARPRPAHAPLAGFLPPSGDAHDGCGAESFRLSKVALDQMNGHGLSRNAAEDGGGSGGGGAPRSPARQSDPGPHLAGLHGRAGGGGGGGEQGGGGRRPDLLRRRPPSGGGGGSGGLLRLGGAEGAGAGAAGAGAEGGVRPRSGTLGLGEAWQLAAREQQARESEVDRAFASIALADAGGGGGGGGGGAAAPSPRPPPGAGADSGRSGSAPCTARGGGGGGEMANNRSAGLPPRTPKAPSVPSPREVLLGGCRSRSATPAGRAQRGKESHSSAGSVNGASVSSMEGRRARWRGKGGGDKQGLDSDDDDQDEGSEEEEDDDDEDDDDDDDDEQEGSEDGDEDDDERVVFGSEFSWVRNSKQLFGYTRIFPRPGDDPAAAAAAERLMAVACATITRPWNTAASRQQKAAAAAAAPAAPAPAVADGAGAAARREGGRGGAAAAAAAGASAGAARRAGGGAAGEGEGGAAGAGGPRRRGSSSSRGSVLSLRSFRDKPG